MTPAMRAAVAELVAVAPPLSEQQQRTIQRAFAPVLAAMAAPEAAAPAA